MVKTAKTKNKAETTEERNFSLLYNKALHLLSYRPRSTEEVRTRLVRFARKKKLGRQKTLIGQVIVKLQEESKLDDLKFAKWWIGQRIEFKPRGKMLLVAELMKKGVSDAVAQKAIQHYWQEEVDVFGVKRQAVDEKTLAIRAAKKKVKSFENLPESEAEQKLLQYLTRRGFKFDVVKEVSKEVIKNERQ